MWQRWNSTSKIFEKSNDDGASWTALGLDGAILTQGTVAPARLGSGSGGSSKFLREDSTWQTVTIPPIYIAYGADQSADFTAAFETIYNLSGTHTVTLPAVSGNGGKRIGFINKGTGAWTMARSSSDTILGATSYLFDFGQYSSIFFYADATNSKWDIF